MATITKHSRRRTRHQVKKPKSESTNKHRQRQPKNVFIPKPGRDEIRTLILGGISEIGKNMYAIEYNDNIVILECGTMFGESTTPGVDIVMPNIQYLKERKQNIKALVVTDASMKHIGAIPYAMQDLNNPTIYVRSLTEAVIKNHQKNMRRAPQLNVHTIEKQESIKIADDMTLHFFGISEENPSTLGVLIETGSGCITYTGGIKIKNKDGVIPESEKKQFEIVKDKKVILALSNSINSERPGFAIADKEIAKEVIQILQEVPQRTLLPLVPSQVKRNSMILEGALKLGKKIYVEGSLLLENLQAACDLETLQIPKEAIIPIEEIEKEDDQKKVLIISSATENEQYKALEEMSLGTYKYATITKDDTAIFPTPLIPTSAQATQNLKDQLSRMKATIRSYDTSDVKGGVHAGKDELKWIHEQIHPKYFIPIQGYHYMLTANTHILRDIGVQKEACVLPENGSIIDISADGNLIKKQKQTLPNTPISIDGHTPSLVQEIVIQDRKTLAQEGIFIIIAFIDQKKLTLKKSPDIISRGFIYLRESQDLIARARIVIKKAAEKEAKETGRVEIDKMKKAIQKETQNFLMNETNKRPIVVSVVFTQ